MDCRKSLGQRMLYALCLIIMMSACSETDDVASALLYQDDDEETETGVVSFEMREVGQWDLGDGSILYGIDMIVRNTLTDQPAEDIRLTLEQVSPTSFVEDISPDRREIDILFASQTTIFDNYWCFNCNEGNEVRIGNFYVLINNSAGSGQSYNLRFTGRYEVESNRTDVDFTRSIRSVASAPSAPALSKNNRSVKE